MRAKDFLYLTEDAIDGLKQTVQNVDPEIKQDPRFLDLVKKRLAAFKNKLSQLATTKPTEDVEVLEDTQVAQTVDQLPDYVLNFITQFGLNPSDPQVKTQVDNLMRGINDDKAVLIKQKDAEKAQEYERGEKRGVEKGKVLGRQETVQEYQKFLKDYSDAIDALNSKIVKSEEEVIKAFQAQERLNVKEKKTVKQKTATIKNLRNAINQVFVNKIITPKDKENFLLNPEKQTQLLNFIKQAATGIIHFGSVLEAGADGNVASIRDLIPEEYKDIYNTFARSLYDVRPNTTAGSWGPGEVGLIILGDPVTKASDGGDLTDGTHKFELKASNDPKKGGRLSPKGIATSPIVKKFDKIKQEFFFSHLNDKQKKQEPFADLAKTNTIGKTSIPLINHAIDSIEHITGKKFDGIGFMNECIKACFTDNVPTDKELNQYVVPMIGGERVEKVKEGGRVKVIPHPVPRGYDYDKFVRGYAKFLYNRYKGVGQEEEHFKNIIVFNPGQETYTVIDGADDFDNPKVIVTGGIEYGGSQVPKSPQVGVEGIQD